MAVAAPKTLTDMRKILAKKRLLVEPSLLNFFEMRTAERRVKKSQSSVSPNRARFAEELAALDLGE